MSAKVEGPRQVLEALLSGQALPFAPEAVEQARRLAQGARPQELAEVAKLPAPLAGAVLESAVRSRNLALLEAAANAGDKALAKAGKRALYQLRSQGVEVPTRAPVPAPHAVHPARGESFPGLLSPITGLGERALVLAREAPRGLELLQAVLSDQQGVTQLSVLPVSRPAYRKQLEQLRREVPGVAEIPLEEAKERLSQAAGLNLASRTPYPSGLQEALNHLDLAPVGELLPLPAPVPDDERIAALGRQLHQEPELAAWLPPESELAVLSAKAQEVLKSPLELSEQQRRLQLVERFRAQARAFMTPPMRQLYGRRLWEMAQQLDRTDRPDRARIARAEARRLYHGALEPFSPFAEELFEKVLRLLRSLGPDPQPAPSGEPPPPPTPPGEKRSPGGLILP